MPLLSQQQTKNIRLAIWEHSEIPDINSRFRNFVTWLTRKHSKLSSIADRFPPQNNTETVREWSRVASMWLCAVAVHPGLRPMGNDMSCPSKQGLIAPATNQIFEERTSTACESQIGVQMDEMVSLSPSYSTSTVSPEDHGCTLYITLSSFSFYSHTTFVPAMMNPEASLFSAVSPHRGLGYRDRPDFAVP